MKKSEVCFLFLLSLFCFACSDSADKEEMEFPEKDNLKVTFPSDFSPEWAASVAGKEVTIVNPLFVTQTYSGSKPQGTIVVSSKVKRAFADVNLPSVVEYSKWVEKQEVDKLADYIRVPFD